MGYKGCRELSLMRAALSSRTRLGVFPTCVGIHEATLVCRKQACAGACAETWSSRQDMRQKVHHVDEASREDVFREDTTSTPF